MSITTTTTKVTYNGDGATTAFPFSFAVQLTTDLQVWITDAAGNQTELFTNFQVDLVNSRVLYPTTGSPLAADGSKITLARVLPLTQETVLTDTGPLPATVIEKALDKLTQITQQIMEVIGRTLTLPIGETPIDFNTLIAEIEAAAGNAAAAAASAVAAAASAASLATPIPINKGGTNSTTALINGKIMQSSGGQIVESALDLSVVASLAAIPAGVSADFRGTVAPAGWLLEDGSEVNRATYAALFAVIGTAYGAGNGSTTFNLPDSRGRVSVGAGQGAGLANRTVGQTFGEENHVLTTQEMPVHGHGVVDPGHAHLLNHVSAGGGQDTYLFGNNGNAVSFPASSPMITGSTTGIQIQAAGGGVSHNNLQPSLVALKIIKT